MFNLYLQKIVIIHITKKRAGNFQRKSCRFEVNYLIYKTNINYITLDLFINKLLMENCRSLCEMIPVNRRFSDRIMSYRVMSKTDSTPPDSNTSSTSSSIDEFPLSQICWNVGIIMSSITGAVQCVSNYGATPFDLLC